MDWIEVNSKEDVDYLNDIFGNFHDSCLKEICFSSGGYVQEDLSMHALGQPIARFLFQRQWENPSAIEIEFRDVIQINIKPEGENEFVDIMIEHLYLYDNIFFWSARDYEIHEADKDCHTWISAKSVYWRIRDDFLGNKKIYMQD